MFIDLRSEFSFDQKNRIVYHGDALIGRKSTTAAIHASRYHLRTDDTTQFNSIYWLKNAVIAEKPFNSHKMGVWGWVESLHYVGIHFNPTRVQS